MKATKKFIQYNQIQKEHQNLKLRNFLWDEPKMSENEVEVTLTSSQGQTETTTKLKKSSWKKKKEKNTWTLAGGKPYSQGH